MSRCSFWRGQRSSDLNRRRIGAGAHLLLALLAATLSIVALPARSAAKVSEETVRIPGPLKGLKLGVRHAWIANAPASLDRSVLILPGAAVPVSGNPDYPFA